MLLRASLVCVFIRNCHSLLDMKQMKFPKGFLWGTATSGHQIEGGNVSSDWWRWEQQGRMHGGAVSGQAVDYWNRYEEDHALMESLGYPVFRIGIEWARIEPEPGKFDREALAHYRDILQSLKNHGIKICLTLYHWVLPHWVAERGDWTNPETLRHFERYARYVINELITFPDLWVTVNEPMVAAIAGNLLAEHPPFRNTFRDYRQTAVSLLRVHAQCYAFIHDAARRAELKKPPRVGIANAYPVLVPWGSRGWKGFYEWSIARLGKYLACHVWDNAVDTGHARLLNGFRQIPGLRGSIDYCGINYYLRMSLRFDHSRRDRFFIDETGVPPGVRSTDTGWQIYPSGLYKAIHDVWNRFKKPVIITENGIADISDEQRPAYILEHLFCVYQALQSGIPVEGYFYWSFIDNFEWRKGFGPRFGLIAVDHRDHNLVRYPRPSAHLYSQIIRENAISEELIGTYAPELMGPFETILKSGNRGRAD
ncbi:MAG: beta-glucosidase [Verrucomicrobiota bacterium]|nr:beta-glucosidase [Verrucomicrobiota bacterium]MDK2963016.1 beta-glucosidase [Verrucomicrobiota bacterium]